MELRLLDPDSEAFTDLASKYQFGLIPTLSVVNSSSKRRRDATSLDPEYAFATTRVKGFIRTSAATRRQDTGQAEEIQVDMEAVYNVVGEKDEATESKLEDEAYEQITEAIKETLGSRLDQATESDGTFKAGELNFARQASENDIEEIKSENGVLADYGPYIEDCLCVNETRSDYAKCIPVDETIHVSHYL